MELLAVVLLWPLLILVLAVVVLSGYTVGGGSFAFLMIVVFFILAFGIKGKLGNPSTAFEADSLDAFRRGIVAFSVGLLLPMWVKYLLSASNNNLIAIIVGLIVGFGVLTWGMFIKDYKVLTYANIIGGVLIVAYLYFQLWNLGPLAQVVGAAFGLVVAVTIAAVKLREKLA